MDEPLRLFVVALAKEVMPGAALRIDKIERRPIIVVELAPDRSLAVDRDRIVDDDTEGGRGVEETDSPTSSASNSNAVTNRKGTRKRFKKRVENTTLLK